MAEGAQGIATVAGPHDRPIELVRDWLEGSGGGAVLVEGGIGSGKSRALRRATAAAAAGGAAVAVRRATELDHLAPLTTLTMTLRGDPAVAGVGAAFDPSPDRRLALVDDLTARIAEAARRRPLLLGIDDVDRGDELSLLIMRLIVPSLAGERVLWVSTAHAGAIPSIPELDLARVRLGALDAGGVARVIGEELGAPPDSDLVSRCAVAEGDPFVLLAVCRAMLAARAVHVVDGRAVAVDGAAAVHGGRPAIVEAVRWRLGRYPRPVRRALGAGATLGDPFSVHAVTDLLDMPAGDVATALGVAVRDGLLVEDGDRLAFRSPLVAAAVYEDLDVPTRQAWHGSAAEAERHDGGEARRVADHLVRSGPRGRARAAQVLRGLARQHAVVDPAVAAATARHAVDLTDPDDPELPATVVEAVTMLVGAGRVREARATAEKHLRPGLSAVDEAAIVAALVPVLMAAGEPWTLVEHLRRTSHRPDLPPEHHAELTGLLAYASVLAGDLGAASSLASEAMDRGEALAAPTAVVWATSASAMLRLVAGDVEQGVADARRAVAATDRAGTRLVHHRPRAVLGLALTLAGRLDEAEAVSVVAEREMDGSGNIGRSWAWARRALHAWLRDRPDETAEAAQAGVAACADEAEPMVSLLALWSLAELRRGDVDAARVPLARARERWGRRGRPEHPRLLLAELVLSLETGARPATLASSARAVVAALAAHPGVLLGLPDATNSLLRIARDAGDDDLVRDVLAHADGLVALNPGLPAFALAAASLRSEPMPPFAVEPEIAAVTLRPVEAVPGSRDGRTTSGTWGLLTAAEARVARLVADGLTNKAVARRLAISRHTVDSHLRHAYAKLGVTSRVELTLRAVAEAQDVAPQEEAVAD